MALAFENGDPAVVEVPRNRGTVVMVATSADTGWTTWPIHKSYPPVMQQIVLRASAGRLSERNIRVGQPYDQSFPEAGSAAPVTVVTPKGQAITTKLQPDRGVSQFHFEQTDLSGPVPGPDRPAPGIGRVRSPPTPTRPRATSPSSTSPPWPR